MINSGREEKQVTEERRSRADRHRRKEGNVDKKERKTRRMSKECTRGRETVNFHFKVFS